MSKCDENEGNCDSEGTQEDDSFSKSPEPRKRSQRSAKDHAFAAILSASENG